MPDLTRISTGKAEFDTFYPRIEAFLKQDTMDLVIDGQTIHGYRSPDCPAIWLRDHSDIMRGCRYFETDLVSTVQHFADTQAANGRLFDFVTNQSLNPETAKENWVQYVRVPVEADVEYRFVKAAFLAWQSTGNNGFIEKLMPSLERALEYVFTHPWRWDSDRQLVKRAYTIDSWDFAYTAGMHDWLQFQIDDNTFWGIMHGDNSGYYEACRLMAHIYTRIGKDARARYWSNFAEGLRDRLNATCWNGRFYTHFVKTTPVDIPGLDEENQLSFSNAMDINRGVTSHSQAVSILNEYLGRKKENQSFAEWYSIDPAFPNGAFGDEKLVPGAYVNGGILPLVGGELARAYLENGFEEQGVATLRQYYGMIEEKNETFLWYFPDGRASSVETSTSPDAMPTDGWGSSAMLYGFMEGLAGIQDHGCCLDVVRLCPRWAAAGVDSAEVETGYAASGARFGYQYQQASDSLKLEIISRHSLVDIHLLLPTGAEVASVSTRSGDLEFAESTVGQSHYLDCQLAVMDGAEITVRFR
ncbi:MAG: hypothetical protein AB3N64_03500 [Puniceicoccaceae bacterium]